MMKDDIVVVGGYGRVGRIICEELANRWPGKVVAAGRSIEKSQRYSLETSGKVKSMQLDVRNIPEPGFFERTRLVIMCLDQTDISFVRACLESAIGTPISPLMTYFSEKSKRCMASRSAVGLPHG